jgi:hypothetical protein
MVAARLPYREELEMGFAHDLSWRRLVALLAAGTAIAVLLAMSVSPQARAGGNGATVIGAKGIGCQTSDSTGDVWTFSCNQQLVIQPDGRIVQYVNGSVITADSSPLPSRPVTDITTADNGLPCFSFDFGPPLGLVTTYVVAGEITPSGQVHLTCRS